MEANSILLNRKDNVVTALVSIAAGGRAYYFRDGDCLELFVREDIPVYHKIALEDMELSHVVVKYGEPIGEVTRPIKMGGLVNHNNIGSIPRNYDDEIGRE